MASREEESQLSAQLETDRWRPYLFNKHRSSIIVASLLVKDRLTSEQYYCDIFTVSNLDFSGTGA
ncbi:hypothetical protein RRG08_011201 [Elysia crispata]|uniref:Uncharacterized protein n=1 Tax=Elysia crispata TaxID=231223 RepID=A0AAE1DJI4_9GAST|nr:hypothetical protein RRG08_011201 [Elysia crispata]